MLVFVDESGDLGFKFKRGSTRFFTIALVVFENSEAVLSCQQAIEGLRNRLELFPRFEFHFHGDNHDLRLAFLSTVAWQDFTCYTFTLDKASPMLTGRGLRQKDSGYKWVCRIVLENVAGDLEDATVIIDGSGERKFRQQLEDV